MTENGIVLHNFVEISAIKYPVNYRFTNNVQWKVLGTAFIRNFQYLSPRRLWVLERTSVRSREMRPLSIFVNYVVWLKIAPKYAIGTKICHRKHLADLSIILNAFNNVRKQIRSTISENDHHARAYRGNFFTTVRIME